MRELSITIVVLAAILFIPPHVLAKTFYLKNGEQIEYQSYRQKGETIFLLINRDTEVEFAVDEVDLPRTVKVAEKEKNRAGHKKRLKRAQQKPAAKHAPAVIPAPVGKPAPAGQPGPKAAPAPAKAKTRAAAQG